MTDPRRAQGGYAMVALLVGIAVMGVMLSMAMPAWRTMVKREKEEELVFRGQQYARAIGLFQRKFANAYPPTIDVLVEQKFLRRKYRDPMAPREDEKGEFQVLYQNTSQVRPGQAVGGRAGTIGDPRGQGSSATLTGAGLGGGEPVRQLGGSAGLAPGGPRGGVIGVASKSKDKSLRVYNGRTVYNEWQFVWVTSSATPGGPGAERPGMGGPGRQGGPGRGSGPGGVGTQSRPPSALDPRRQ